MSDDTLNRRNTESVKQALNDLTDRVLLQQQRIDGLLATVGTLSSRVLALEQLILVDRAVRAGHGPTVR